MNCKELLLVLCYTNLHPCSTPLRLCCFSVWPQRTLVLTSSNTRPGLPPCHAAECSRVHRPPLLSHASFALRQQPGMWLVHPGMWHGKAFSYQAEKFPKAGMLEAAHHLASVPYFHLISSYTRCGHTAIQHANTSPAPAEDRPQNTIQ